MIANVHLQKRDIDTMLTLGSVQIATGEMLRDHHYPTDRTGESFRRRARKIEQVGLFRSVNVHLAYMAGKGGRLPKIYSLTPEGVALLRELTGEDGFRYVDEINPMTALHRLGVSDFLLRLRSACDQYGLRTPRWILEFDPIDGAKANAPFEERFVLYERFEVDGATVSCRPDASIHLAVPAQSSQQKPTDLVAYLEYDRSTDSLRQILGKMPGYQQLLATKRWKKHWPQLADPTIRIFFVCQSRERVQTIAGAIRKHPVAAAVRLLSLTDATPETLLTDRIWRTTEWTGEDDQKHSLAIIKSQPQTQTP